MRHFTLKLFVFLFKISFSQIYFSENFENYSSVVDDILKSNRKNEITFSIIRDNTVVEKLSAKFSDKDVVKVKCIKIPYEKTNEEKVYKYYRGIYYKPKMPNSKDYDSVIITNDAITIFEFFDNEFARKTEKFLDSLDRNTKTIVITPWDNGMAKTDLFEYSYSSDSLDKETIEYKHSTSYADTSFVVQTIVTKTFKVLNKKNNTILIKSQSVMKASGKQFEVAGQTLQTYNSNNQITKVQFIDNQFINTYLLIEYK